MFWCEIIRPKLPCLTELFFCLFQYFGGASGVLLWYQYKYHLMTTSWFVLSVVEVLAWSLNSFLGYKAALREISG